MPAIIQQNSTAKNKAEVRNRQYVTFAIADGRTSDEPIKEAPSGMVFQKSFTLSSPRIIFAASITASTRGL